MEPTQYPLTWPDTLPRSERKATSQFRTGLNGALKNVRESLVKFSADTSRKLGSITISSNCTLGQEKPADPGVAVWFVWDGMQVCIAVDRYPKVQENLQAIHLILEARRTEFRHGGIHIVKATFRGFQALPSPDGLKKKTWRQVLGVKDGRSPQKSSIDAQYRKLSKTRHPDSPTGSTEKMAELNSAKEEALREIGEIV